MALAAALLVTGLATAPGAVSWAAEAPAAEAAAPAAASELARRVEERYRVLPTRDGLLLEPRGEVPGVRSIELAGGEVAVNGEPVSATILRSWFGSEAEPLLELAALPVEEARELMGVGSEAELVPAEPAGPSGEPAAGDEEGASLETYEEEAAARDDEEPYRRGDQVYLGERFSFGGSVTIEEDEVASEVVVIGGSVHILGEVDGDVVAVGGTVAVDGTVGGDVVAVGGGVHLGPESRVERDVVSVGGGVHKSRNARVGGQTTEVAFPWVWGGGLDWAPGSWAEGPSVRSWAISDAISNAMLIAFLALVACLIVLVARGSVERAAGRLQSEPWSALAAGIATIFFLLFGLPVVIVLLILTVVGCLALPLLVIVFPALLVIALVGYTAAAVQLGRALADRFGWRGAGVYMPLLLGILGIETWSLVADVLQIPGGPVRIVATIFLLIGLLIEIGAWLAGLGAVVMNLFAGRRRGAPTALPPAVPPPVPPEPPAQLPGEPPPPTAGGLPPEASASEEAAGEVWPPEQPSDEARPPATREDDEEGPRQL
jgi:hypothetical protein